MSHLALYRKYRSQTFGDLIGQEHVTRTLQNALATGQIAHAYLFTGPRGTGKTSSARLLAKALNCEKGPTPEPCNECDSCLSITGGRSLDVLEMDAASESGVDDVREKIVEVSEYAPAASRYKIFIIDEVHDLSSKAFDSLLKTIEEPPAHVVFILATTEYNKVPPTIRSRCQRYDFHRGTVAQLAERLQHVVTAEGVDADPAAIAAMARMADGGYRDALTLLEQAILTSGGKITLGHVYDQLGMIPEDMLDGILSAMRREGIAELMAALDDVYRSGRDARALLDALIERLAILTRAFYGLESGAGLDSAADAALKAKSNELGGEWMLRARQQLSEDHQSIREVSLPRIWLESRLLGLAQGTVSTLATPVAVSAVPPTPASVMPPVKLEAAPPQEAAVDSQSTRVVTTELTAKNAPAEPQTEATLIWRKIVEEIAAISKAARIRLASSQITEDTDTRVTVGLARQLDADWVNQNAKLKEAILERWRGSALGERQLVFVAMPKMVTAATTELEAATVESPLTGERLKNAVQEIFEQSSSQPE